VRYVDGRESNWSLSTYRTLKQVKAAFAPVAVELPPTQGVAPNQVPPTYGYGWPALICLMIFFAADLNPAVMRAAALGAVQAKKQQMLADLQQRAAGRFERPTNVRLRKVMDWLDYNKVVPGDVRLQVWLAFGFLLVCLLNTVGLLLAKFLRRSSEVGVRRALGASRRAIFMQCLIEAGTVGLAGGIAGLGLSWLGLWAVRQQPASYAELAHLDPWMLLITFALAIIASVLAGLIPAWQAMQVTPAMQLKSQ
jgi:predicted lysophospholipase L1 biosynthesis ABC-type transport system permease subunit